MRLHQKVGRTKSTQALTTMQGNRNLMALLDAVIGLLDAEGEPAGLGEGLQGVYAKTWWAIVGRLR